MKIAFLFSSVLMMVGAAALADSAVGPEKVYKSVYNGLVPTLESRITQVTMKFEFEINDPMLSLDISSCSGTLIAPDIILTAAHCLDIPPELLTANLVKPVVTYKDLKTGKFLKVSVAKMLAHPYYNKKNGLGGKVAGYDVALLKLATPITDRAPVDLYSSAILPPRFNIIVAGWGLNHLKEIDPTQDRQLNAMLEEAKKLDPKNPNDMAKGKALLEKVTARMLALNDSMKLLLAGQKVASVTKNPRTQQKFISIETSPVAICKGDSGGPSFVETANGFFQIGIHSTGSVTNCDRESIIAKTYRAVAKYDAYDTFIPEYIDWIIVNANTF